jgi:hypothetical protein
MSRAAAPRRVVAVTRFLLHHRHGPDDCGVVFAAFRGFVSPLRRGAALASCRGSRRATQVQEINIP